MFAGFNHPDENQGGTNPVPEMTVLDLVAGPKRVLITFML